MKTPLPRILLLLCVVGIFLTVAAAGPSHSIVKVEGNVRYRGVNDKNWMLAITGKDVKLEDNFNLSPNSRVGIKDVKTSRVYYASTPGVLTAQDIINRATGKASNVVRNVNDRIQDAMDNKAQAPEQNYKTGGIGVVASLIGDESSLAVESNYMAAEFNDTDEAYTDSVYAALRRVIDGIDTVCGDSLAVTPGVRTLADNDLYTLTINNALQDAMYVNFVRYSDGEYHMCLSEQSGDPAPYCIARPADTTIVDNVNYLWVNTPSKIAEEYIMIAAPKQFDADRIALMLQLDTPSQQLESPADVYITRFIPTK